MARITEVGGLAAASTGTDVRAVHAWISRFLADKPLSDMRKIAEWQAWATARIAESWNAEAVKQHIADRWTEHARAIGLEPAPPTVQPGSDLYRELVACIGRVMAGETPEQTAAVYRSLAREHPEHAHWLARYAAMYADMGPHWQHIGPRLASGW